MKWGVGITFFVLSMLILTSAHSLENQESSFEKVTIYYFQPIGDQLAVLNISGKPISDEMITKYTESFHFNETNKEDLLVRIKGRNDSKTQLPIFQDVWFDKVSKIPSIKIRINGSNDNRTFYIYPTLFLAEYTPDETSDLADKIYGFEKFTRNNVTDYIGAIDWSRSQPVSTTYTNRFHNGVETRVVVLQLKNTANISNAQEELTTIFPYTQHFKIDRIDCKINQELYAYKQKNVLIIIDDSSLNKEKLIPVFNLLYYIYPYEDKETAVIEGEIKNFSQQLILADLNLTSSDLTVLNKTQTDLKKSFNNYSRINQKIEDLQILSRSEEQLLINVKDDENCYFQLYRENIETHNRFFKRDVMRLETQNQNLINDYKRLEVQLRSRAEFLEQLEGMNSQIKLAIYGVIVAVLAALIAAIGLIMTWYNSKKQTPIFEKIKQYLGDLRKPKEEG